MSFRVLKKIFKSDVKRAQHFCLFNPRIYLFLHYCIILGESILEELMCPWTIQNQLSCIISDQA